MGARCGLLHRRVEKGIAEEVQRATKNNSGIISGLKASNQESVLANSMGVLVRFTKHTNKETKKLLGSEQMASQFITKTICNCIRNSYSTQIFFVRKNMSHKTVYKSAKTDNRFKA